MTEHQDKVWDELARLRAELTHRLDEARAARIRLEAEVGALREALSHNASRWEAEAETMRADRARVAGALASAEAEAAEGRRRAEQFSKQASWASRQLALLVDRDAVRDAELCRRDEELALFRIGAARLLGVESVDADLVSVLGRLRVRIRELEREADQLVAAQAPQPLAAPVSARGARRPLWRRLVDGLRASAANSTGSRMPDKARASSIGS